MLRKIKYCLLVVILILICAAVVKDKIFDTPQRSREKIMPFLKVASKNDITTNIFASQRLCVYKMYYWSLIPMGEFTFSTSVNDLGNIFNFKATTQGSFIEKFVRAEASLESYYSKNIQLPYKYAEITRVNGKMKTKEILFDQANLIATRGDKKFKIPLDCFDPISAFVRMLTLPFNKNEIQKIRFASGKEVYLLKSTVLNENDDIADVLIDMRRENLTSSHGANFHAWITQDNARIPLVFKSWTPAGYFSVVLDRVSLNNEENIEGEK